MEYKNVTIFINTFKMLVSCRPEYLVVHASDDSQEIKRIVSVPGSSSMDF
jgi:hypothetical protein